MIRQRLIPRGRAAVLIALLCLAVPASAYFERVTVLFLASFNVAGPPNGSITAEIGQFNPVTPPQTFTVVPAGGGGTLKVSDGGTVAPAKLQAIFNKVFDGNFLVLNWQLQLLQADSGLVFRVDDAGETGILDCGWDGGGVLMNGVPTGAHFDAGASYDVTLRLTNGLLGVATWQLEIREGGMLVWLSTGVLNLGHPLTIKQVEIIRPAGEPAGTFFVDEIKATSYDMLPK